MVSVPATERIKNDISGYLADYQSKELLRFVAVGSVDDGKSTLIGRMLHDTGMVYEDQLAAVRKASAGDEIDFALFTDGLRAEREQGITIDVAYRYFTTDKRKFIIADTPGHIQYTRNMVTGASTANVALILIDARLGVLQQSRRHAYLASLLGIPHLAVCVNKMDLVGFDEGVYNNICKELRSFTDPLGFTDVTSFPISALKGDNIVGPSANTPWYDGHNVLEYLETVDISQDGNTGAFRFPVQYVLRPNLNYRGFAGQISSGSIKQGDPIISLPSGKTSKVASIDVYDGNLPSAHTPQSVVLRLEDEIDVSRGDMIVHQEHLPTIDRTFDAHLVWMSEDELDLQKTYIIKHTTQNARVQIGTLHHRKDMDTLAEVPADTLALNDIGYVTIQCHRALYFDAYKVNRSTGAFIVIDSLTNNTVAAGMIASRDSNQGLQDALKEMRAGSAIAPKTQVSAKERLALMGQRGATVWLTGLPGSGRWSLAYALERRLFDLGRSATVVDPTKEDLRSMISAASACTDAGLVCICAFPTYQVKDRDALRNRIDDDRLFEIYVNTDEALCRERRPDADFSNFEPPRNPDLVISLEAMKMEDAVAAIVVELEKRGQLVPQKP